ncbi:MAG: oligosaccharide flippase family protein [Coriobacteriia bacterium]|nr:oligosaccharide flippase family protein [Coriobacteriia bacterium]
MSEPLVIRRPRLRLALNTLANASAQVVSFIVTLVTLPLLLRAYGAGTYGLFVLATSVVGVVMMFDFGLGVTTTRQIAAAAAIDDERGLAHTLSASISLHMLIGITATLVLALIAAFAGRFFHVTPVQAALLKLMLIWQAAQQLLTWPAKPGNYVLAGHQRYGTIALFSVISAVLSAAAIIFVLVTRRGPLVLTMLNCAIIVVCTGVMFIIALVSLPPSVRRLLRPQLGSAARTLISLGLPLYIVQMAAFLMRQQANRLIIGIVMGAATVGLFEAAAKLASSISQINDLSYSALLPYVTRLYAREEHEQLASTFVTGSRYLSLMLIPGIFVTVLFAPQLIRLWCGPGFELSGTTARLLLASQLFWPITMVGDTIIIGQGQIKRWAPVALCAGIANVVLALILIHPLGIVGVALATLAVDLTEIPLHLRLTLKLARVPLRDWARRAALPNLPALMLTLVLWLAAGSARLIPHTLIGLVAFMFLVLLIAWLLSAALFLRKDIWRFAKRLRSH